MDDNPIDSLTPKEKDCLRLVSPDRKSAAIAAKLGIAVPTVETHIRSARGKLGGVSRFVAARMLSEHEANQSLTSHAMTIPSTRSEQLADWPSLSETAGSQPLVMSDVRPVFRDREHVGIERASGGRTRLDALNRIALIAFCLLALAVAGIAAVPLSDAVQNVARMVMTQRTN